MITTSAYSQFSSQVQNIDENLLHFTNKLPKTGMKSFECDEKGNFKIVYERAQEGTASHNETKLNETMKGATIKVDSVVKGKLTKGETRGKIEIESGIIISKIFNITLKSVEGVAESTALLVTAKWGPLSKSAKLKQELVDDTKVQWK